MELVSWWLMWNLYRFHFSALLSLMFLKYSLSPSAWAVNSGCWSSHLMYCEKKRATSMSMVTDLWRKFFVFGSVLVTASILVLSCSNLDSNCCFSVGEICPLTVMRVRKHLIMMMYKYFIGLILCLGI